MNTVDLMATIGRLRRAQPRNPDTQAVCDALEKTLIRPVSNGQSNEQANKPRIPLSEAAQAARMPQPPMQLLDAIQEPPTKPAFDKKVYQRDLMRKRRATAKGLPAPAPLKSEASIADMKARMAKVRAARGAAKGSQG